MFSYSTEYYVPTPVDQYLKFKNRCSLVSTLQLKPCTNPTAPPWKPRTRGRPPAAVCFQYFPLRGAWRPAGYTSPFRTRGNHTGNRLPWPPAKGFCMPCRCSGSSQRSARTQPTSAKQTGPLPVEARTASSPTPTLLRICTPHPLRMRGSPHTSIIQYF